MALATLIVRAFPFTPKKVCVTSGTGQAIAFRRFAPPLARESHQALGELASCKVS